MENQKKYNNLSRLVEKLKKSEDPKRKYEYILWLGKKLKEPDSEVLVEKIKLRDAFQKSLLRQLLKPVNYFGKDILMLS